jgi:hypothetical protein
MLLSVHAAPAPAPHPPPSTASVQGASLQRCCSTGSSAWAAQPCWLGSVLASHSANNDSPKLLSRGRYGCIPVGTRRGLGVPMSCPLGSSPSSPSSHPRGISVCAKAGCAKDTPDGACLWCRALCAVVSAPALIVLPVLSLLLLLVVPLQPTPTSLGRRQVPHKLGKHMQRALLLTVAQKGSHFECTALRTDGDSPRRSI